MKVCGVSGSSPTKSGVGPADDAECFRPVTTAND